MAKSDDWSWAEPESKETITVVEPSTPVVASGRNAMIQQRRDELRTQIESSLIQDSMASVLGACRFADINPTALVKPDGAPADWEPPYPHEWEEEGLPPATCRKMMRSAQAAWLNKKEAPIGVTIAQTTLLGLLKIDAMRQTGPKQLNVTAAQIIVTKDYETLRLKSGS